jgi:hypothetical protein
MKTKIARGAILINRSFGRGDFIDTLRLWCIGLWFLLLLLVAAAVSPEARTVTDSAGRRVEVPDKIEKVFAD